MAQIGLLVTELKRYLKAQGVTYASLAKQLDLSESSVKRQFARQSFSAGAPRANPESASGSRSRISSH